MPLQSPVSPSARGKSSHAVRRPQYRAARAFYFAILVISVIAVFIKVNERRGRHGLDVTETLHARRIDLGLRDTLASHIGEAEGAILRRDEAVRNSLCYGNIGPARS